MDAAPTIARLRTRYPDAFAVLDDLLAGIHAALADRLLGLYLYGSLITGDFDPEVSDLDCTAVLTAPLEEQDLPMLGAMHHAMTWRHPGWNDRVEVQYIDRETLQHFRVSRRPMGNISPGEPLHFRETGIDWLMNWYLVTHHSVTLFGPDPRTLVPPISHAEFVGATRTAAREWLARIGGIEGSHGQSYATLTICRALYTHTTGEHVSKARAAAWAAAHYPHWQPTIDRALAWRREPAFPATATRDTAREFVRTIATMILENTPSTTP